MEIIFKKNECEVFKDGRDYVLWNKKTYDVAVYRNLDKLDDEVFLPFGSLQCELSPEIHAAIAEYKQNKKEILKKNNITLWK